MLFERDSEKKVLLIIFVWYVFLDDGVEDACSFEGANKNNVLDELESFSFWIRTFGSTLAYEAVELVCNFQRNVCTPLCEDSSLANCVV